MEGKGIKGPIVMTNGIAGSRSVRRQLIHDTVSAYCNVAPHAAKEAMDYIHDITQVEVGNGEWHSKKGHVKMRMPAELFHCLRTVFNHYLPDEPTFGQEDDLVLLTEEAPLFMREGHQARGRRGKVSR